MISDMVKIVVFDSGLGSLSVIRQIQRQIKCDIVYFADTKNFPYGRKSIREIKAIAENTVSRLESLFKPELIIVGSNTLSLAMGPQSGNVLTVLPPLREASEITKSGTIGIMATESIVKSRLLDEYIRYSKTGSIKIIKINASDLVELVESGKFYSDPVLCGNIIRKILGPIFADSDIDVATLSSTHLPFLLKFLKEIFPDVIFVDPSVSLAERLGKKYAGTSKKNSLQIFTSGDTHALEEKLGHVGIKSKISGLELA